MHKCLYTDRIEIKYKKLTRIVTATYQNKRMKEPLIMEVIKENEELINKCRNVLYSNYGYGYGVIFPNENYYGSPYGTDKYFLTDNDGKKQLPIFCSNKPSEKDIETVLTKYPDFAEISNIIDFKSNEELLMSVHYWNINKGDFKFLIENNKSVMAYSENYYRLSEEKRNRIKNAICSYPTLNTTTTKFLKTVSLKNEFPQFSFETIYRVNNGQTNDKNEIITFIKATKEWKKLNKEQQKEFESFLFTCDKWKAQYFSYPKFRRIAKDKIRYSDTSYSDLLDFETDYMTIENLKEFYSYYYKDFKYTVQKMDKAKVYYYEPKFIRHIFALWTNYPKEVEGLYSLCLTTLAKTEEYYEKSSDFKKKALKLFLKHKNFCKKYSTLTLKDLERLLNSDFDVVNLDEDTLDFIHDNFNYTENLSMKQINYMMKNNIQADEYDTYLKKCRKAKHDMSDSYWLFPNDFEKRMEKVMEEVSNIEKYENEHKDEIYFETVQKFIEKNPSVKIDGYEIYIPETIEDIKFQADMLNQCLIRMDYPKKVIDNNCLLVFLRKDGEPMATCELRQDEIVQFRMKSNSSVTEDMNVAMNKWLEKANLKVA